MPRKKSARGRRTHKVDFRVRPAHFFFVFLLACGFFLINPKPADVTMSNVRQKIMHVLSHEQSEYLTDAYVNDIVAQNGEYDFSANKLAAIFDNNPVVGIQQSPSSQFLTTVLPAYTELHTLAAQDDSKWIEIDLSEQKIMAWENGDKKMEFLVSSGKPWTPTLTGDFRIWIKLRYANMKGGSKERRDYYFLPNVPYVMYYDRGYGIHGAYWHMNFGQPMSHGCVNVKPDEAGQLFAWAGPDMQGKSVIKSSNDNPGTRVVIHE